MRVVMTMVMRDEEDLVAANLDFHLAMGVDLVLVSDHNSTDRTPEILAGYEARGLARVFHRRDERFAQSEWVTEMARLAATEHGADWVINNDADEFWWPVGGRLPDVLAAIPEGYGQLAVPRNDFLPHAGEGEFWERMVVRETRSQNMFGQDLEPNALHRGHPQVEVDQGNHWVSAPGLLAAPAIPVLEVTHYPIRSFEQFEHKVVMQGRAYSSIPDRPADQGRDQLALYELHRRGELRRHYDLLAVDAARLEAGLESGELVVDRRLERFMRALREGSDPLPDHAAHGSLARRVTETAFAVGQRAEAAEAEAESLRAQLADALRRLDESIVSLELLRNSRLQRWTRAPRRVLYRARARR